MASWNEMKVGQKCILEIDDIIRDSKSSATHVMLEQKCTADGRRFASYTPLKMKTPGKKDVFIYPNRSSSCSQSMHSYSKDMSRIMFSELQVDSVLCNSINSGLNDSLDLLNAENLDAACPRTFINVEQEIDNEEQEIIDDNSLSGLSEVTLKDFYPSMLELFSKLITIDSRKNMASRIVKRYRRQMWQSNKSRLCIARERIKASKSNLRQAKVSVKSILFASEKMKQDDMKMASTRGVSLKVASTAEHQPAGNEGFRTAFCTVPNLNKIKYTDTRNTEADLPMEVESNFSKTGCLPNTVNTSVSKPFLSASFPKTFKAGKQETSNQNTCCYKIVLECSPLYSSAEYLPTVKNARIRKPNENVIFNFPLKPAVEPELKYFLPRSSLLQSDSVRSTSNTSCPRVSFRRHSFSFHDLQSNAFDVEREFEAMYRKLCPNENKSKVSLDAILHSLGESREIQMSETVNALVNSPLQMASRRYKRVAIVDEEQPYSRPLKKSRNLSECTTFNLVSSRNFLPDVAPQQKLNRILGSLEQESRCAFAESSEHAGQEYLSYKEKKLNKRSSSEASFKVNQSRPNNTFQINWTQSGGKQGDSDTVSAASGTYAYPCNRLHSPKEMAHYRISRCKCQISRRVSRKLSYGEKCE
ncbi:uncharacterized protein LOC102345557 [Latimeria chalumnae]|uniref:uncharacterized protein LOC102345557 n=1 Tax=Latimeria chalumnae TaxID=7897 RepID=UPI0003C16157